MKTNKKEIEISKNIKFWATSKLVPYEKNARTHSDEQVSEIAASILEFGFTNPVLVDAKCGVIAGHGRLMAAKQLGLKEVPVIVLDHLSDIQKRAYILADNKLALNAGWDEEVLAEELAALIDSGYETDVIGFSKQELADLLPEEAAEENERADSIPEVAQNELGVKFGDIYQLGEHRLMCGDSTDMGCVEMLMDGNKADMVFTDPPYGIGFDYNSYEDTEANWYELIDAIMPVAKKFAPFIVMPSCRIKALKWWYANHSPDWIMCWYKGSPGHASHIGFNDWEPHLVWGKPKNRFHDYWQTTCGFKQEGDKHSCPKPVEYSQWIIERAIDSGDILLELFLGSGSTLIACEKTNRKCFGMELDPHYCSVIIKRWEIFTGKKAKKIFPVKTILKKKK